MKFIRYRDVCEVTRDTGTRDEWDNPVAPLTIYSGECLYEEGGTGYSRSIITRAPTLFIPGNHADIQINDAITVDTEAGRQIKGVVRIVRDIFMDWRAGIECTRIELKQAQGD